MGEGQWSTRRSRGEGGHEGEGEGEGGHEGEGEEVSNAHPYSNLADDLADGPDGVHNDASGASGGGKGSSASGAYVVGPVAATAAAAAAAVAVAVASGGSAAAAAMPPPPVDGGGSGDVISRGGEGEREGVSLRQYMTAHRAASSSAAASSPSSLSFAAAAAAPSSPHLVDSFDSLTAPPLRPFNGSAGGGASGAAPTWVAGQGLGGPLSPSASDPAATPLSLLADPIQHRPSPTAPDWDGDRDMSGGQAGQAPSPRPVASSPGGLKGITLNALAPAPSADMSSHVRTHAILRPPHRLVTPPPIFVQRQPITDPNPILPSCVSLI